MVFMLTPRYYLVQGIDEGADLGGEPEWNFFTYYGKFAPKMHVKMSWLWFLPALFLDSVVNYPLIKWTQRRYAKKPYGTEDVLVILGMLTTLAIWTGIGYVASMGDDGQDNILLSTLFMIIIYAMYFFLPLIVINREDGYKYSNLLKIIGPIATILLNIARDGYNDGQIYGFCAQLNYDLVFMMQGLIDQVFWKEQEKSRNELSKTLWPPVTVFFFFLFMSFTTPVNYNNTFYEVFYYPLYRLTSL